MGRGKQSVCIDLKKKQGQNALKRLCSNVDVLIEPFRPGWWFKTILLFSKIGKAILS